MTPPRLSTLLLIAPGGRPGCDAAHEAGAPSPMVFSPAVEALVVALRPASTRVPEKKAKSPQPPHPLHKPLVLVNHVNRPNPPGYKNIIYWISRVPQSRVVDQRRGTGKGSPVRHLLPSKVPPGFQLRLCRASKAGDHAGKTRAMCRRARTNDHDTSA